MHTTGFKVLSPLEVGDTVIVGGMRKPATVTDVRFVISAAKGTIDIYYYINIGWETTVSLDCIECRIDEHGNRIPLHDEVALYTEIRTQ